MISSFIYSNTFVKCKVNFGTFRRPYKCIIIHLASASPRTFFMDLFHSKYLSHSYGYEEIFSEQFLKLTALYYKAIMVLIIIELLFCILRHATSLQICFFCVNFFFLDARYKLTTVKTFRNFLPTFILHSNHCRATLLKASPQ